ncbi:hypothetical protein BTO11_16335 [Psychrosphaera saromensis]|uniref:Flagellar biosynthesis protein FlgT n=2 Tax=Psychrosphaera saromensis TaxID=716813 RepID=A0A2S7UYJ1_9GAMM|nr:hypothetical protein BTO11_16335 [Psychrosphaera saromensis]
MLNNMTVTKICLTVALMLNVTIANAQWYEATGQAKVRNGDYKSAKTRALQDAVKQAMLFSGANVSSVQKISKGLLVDDQLQVQALGIVDQIEIVEERQSGDMFTITVRADIFAENEECHSSEFSKKVAITQFPIQHWADANIGNLYPLEKEIPRKIQTLLKNEANGIYPVTWLDKKLNVNNDFEQQGQMRHELIDAVANSANTQFVMFGRITDLSFGVETNDYKFWQDDKFERFFALDILVANALTHEVLYQNRYNTEAEWGIPKNQQVNVTSQNFWHDSYGVAIENLLSDMRNDLVAVFSCQKLQSKIMSVKDGGKIQLNIGRAQGVNIGQEYHVSYRADSIDDRNNLLTNFVVSPYRVRITQVYQNTAIAESLDSAFMNNVQVNDVIELKDWDDAW